MDFDAGVRNVMYVRHVLISEWCAKSGTVFLV